MRLLIPAIVEWPNSDTERACASGTFCSRTFRGGMQQSAARPESDRQFTSTDRDGV